MKHITVAIAIATFASVFVAALLYGTGKQEESECMKWQQQADAYPGFFLAQWQKDQCDAHGIKISAPVK